MSYHFTLERCGTIGKITCFGTTGHTTVSVLTFDIQGIQVQQSLLNLFGIYLGLLEFLSGATLVLCVSGYNDGAGRGWG